MPGKIKKMIDTIIEKRSAGVPAAVTTIRVKMTFKGIFPDKYNDQSADDPVIMEKLILLAKEFDIKL